MTGGTLITPPGEKRKACKMMAHNADLKHRFVITQTMIINGTYCDVRTCQKCGRFQVVQM